MFFPHAFEKVFLATAGIAPAGKAGDNTMSLSGAEIGFVDVANNQILDVVTDTTNAVYKDTPLIMLAQGSLQQRDSYGMHGGYQASVKSKGINPKYVSKFFVSAPTNPVAGQYSVGFLALATILLWDNTYRFRVDIKGSPIMRLLGRNAYHTFDVATGCAIEGEVPDHANIMEALAAQINDRLIMNEFIQATVEYVTNTDATTEATRSTDRTAYDAETTLALKTAVLVLDTAYVDTKFGNSSFSVQDHYELSPIELFASVLDQTGEPCESDKFTIATRVQAKQGTGYGETLLRDLILSKRYEGEDFSGDPRMREVLGDTSLTSIDRNGKYFVYTILHSVPRKSNPSGIFDNDQYALRIVTTARIASLEAWMNAYLSNANNAVQLEVM
jgi:hypothetical protein